MIELDNPLAGRFRLVEPGAIHHFAEALRCYIEKPELRAEQLPVGKFIELSNYLARQPKAG